MSNSEVLARLAQLEAQHIAAAAKIARLEDALAAALHSGSPACDARASGEVETTGPDGAPPPVALPTAALSAPAVSDTRTSALPKEKPLAAKRVRSPSAPPRCRAATPPPPTLPPAVKAEHAESELESLLRHYTLDKVSISAGEAQEVMATRGGFSRDRFAVRELCRLDLPCYARQGYSAHLAHLLSSGQRPAATALLRAIRQHELGGGGAAPEAGFFGRGRGAAPVVDLAGEEEVEVLEKERVEMDLTGEEETAEGAEAAPPPSPPVKLED